MLFFSFEVVQCPFNGHKCHRVFTKQQIFLYEAHPRDWGQDMEMKMRYRRKRWPVKPHSTIRGITIRESLLQNGISYLLKLLNNRNMFRIEVLDTRQMSLWYHLIMVLSVRMDISKADELFVLIQ